MIIKKQFISPDEAVQVYEQVGYGKITRFAIIEWIKRYGFGWKVAGRWKIDKNKFEQFLKKGI